MIAYVMLGANLHGLMRPKMAKQNCGKNSYQYHLDSAWFYLWFPIYFGPLYNGGVV